MTLEVLDLHHVQISATKDTEMPTAHFYSDQQPIEGWIRFYIRDPADNRVEFAQVTS
jgi:hypothetical protein